MRTEAEIRAALETLNRVWDSRCEINVMTHDTEDERLAASLADSVEDDASTYSEALEWVLGINDDPGSPNSLEAFLARYRH